MKLITERSLIKEVAENWRQHYPTNRQLMSASSDAIHSRLLALDLSTATADDVSCIIGNDLWTRIPPCGECNRSVSVVVEIGEPRGYESDTARVCLDCLRRAAELIRSTP